MLRNEKYMGDALLQKTYTVDFMTKKKVMNKGIVPQYYVEDDHEAIIPKDLFYRVQEELARRASVNKSAVVWRCSNRLTNGTKYCKDSVTLEEGILNRAVMEAIHRITRNDGNFASALRQNVIRVIGSYGMEQEIRYD